MMRKNCFFMVLTAVLLLVTGISPLGAEQIKDIIANEDVFGELQRPPAVFSHDLHMSAFADQGCGGCHHIFDENTGKLVYREGEELGCIDCHEKEKAGNTPGLREAYHGICNACHRSMHKKHMKSGPMTCGECHPKK